jgi:hypothetical protein
MAFENMDTEPSIEEAGPPPEESSNRPFLIGAAILGGIMLLSLLCVAVYAFFVYPTRKNAKATEDAVAMARSTQAALAVMQTQQAKAWTSTPTQPRPTKTPLPTFTSTPVVAIPATTTAATMDPRTATVAALLTEAANKQKTPMAPTSTSLPSGGLADEVGLPAFVALAIALVVVIFLARRLRTAR